MRKMDKNISNENYEKLNYLSKIKEVDQIVRHNKRAPCLTKGHLDNPEGQVEVDSPPNRKLFLISFIHIKKKFFFKKGTFNKVPDDPRTLKQA